MSIFNTIFGQRQQQQPQQQPQQQAPQQQAQPGAQNNPTVPNQSNTPQQQQQVDGTGGGSPNNNFADLWKMEPAQQASQGPNFKLNPQQLQTAVSSMDFAKNVSQEDMQKIFAGGQDAMQAFSNVLNQFGRNLFSTNAQFSSNLVESGYNASQQSLQSGLPSMVKKQFSQQELFQANPKLRDPALQPLVLAIQSQITEKFPSASPSEVNSMVEQYFNKTVAGAFTQDTPQQQQSGPRNDDFSSFLS